MNSIKRLKVRTLTDEFPRSVGARYATWEEWRNNSRKDEEMEPKQKQHPAVDMIGDVHSCHLLFDHFQFALIHGPNIPGSYAILLFTASDFTSITNHILNWVLFLLWLHPFILSEVISPLLSSSILGTYRPGEFIFQCHTFLPFHSVHGVLKTRILKWFAIPFSSWSHFVRMLCYDLSILCGPTVHDS